MHYLLPAENSTTKYLAYMAKEVHYLIQIEQQIILTQTFETKIKNYNRQELLFTKASLIAYKNIEKRDSNQLTDQYIQLINKQLKTLSITED